MSATEAAERQKDKILPLSGADVPKTPQLPNNGKSTGGNGNSKDKMLWSDVAPPTTQPLSTNLTSKGNKNSFEK